MNADSHPPTQQPNKPAKRFAFPKLRFNKKIVIIAIAITVSLAAVVFVFEYIKTRDALMKAQNPQQAAKLEAEDLAKEIGRFLELPKDEAPTIATVNDAEKLKSQTFFTHTENGDKVLVYAVSKKAVLYRPSTKKVIEYAPVSLGE